MATARKFSKEILKHLDKTYPESAFKATFVDGRWRRGRFSGRRQAELRKACLVNQVDSASIGLPPLAPRSSNFQKKAPKGHKQQRTYAEKQAAIQKNLDDMPNKIKKWKDDLAKEKHKLTPTLPF
ncbi:hypothetical protein H4217_005234 [Coemansia sp. RSA 1939]|nr:hypothetical protein H4217_005234 [Coemansia sp. RSA 1939]KAJ2682912.1 hypothetical protein GGH99_004554 [Coemansia sp. RSA 1285]